MRKWIVFALLLIASNSGFATDIYLIRHFEKQSGPDPELTEAGSARAQALAEYFENKPLAAVYSTATRRTLQTADPVAVAVRQPVTEYSASELTTLAHTLIERDEAVLVVGHSNTTPQLAKALGAPEFVIADDEYGVLYHLVEVDGAVQMHTRLITLD